MKHNSILNYIYLVTGILISFLVSELLLIFTVFFLGPYFSMIILIILLGVISILTNKIIDMKEERIYNFHYLKKFRDWLILKEKKLPPFLIRVAMISKLLAILFSSFIFGPLTTAILIKFLGYSRIHSYLLSIISTIIFTCSWVFIYNQGINITKDLLL